MAPTPFPGLSSVQAQVLLSLASGASITAAARSVGVGRSTIHSWLQNEPTFAELVEQAKNDYVETLRDQLRDASTKALATLVSILDDPNAPASVRLKASLAILNRPQFPDRGWRLPEKIEEPAKEQFLDTMDELEANHRSMRLAQELNKTRQNSEVSEPACHADPLKHGTATAKERTTPIQSNKVGRNEPCPCGSGIKFKRCCLNKPQNTPEPQT